MSYFSNGGVIGKLLDYNTSETYVTGNKKNSGIWNLDAVWSFKSSNAKVVWTQQLDGDTTPYTGDLQIGDVLFAFTSSSFGLYDYDGGGNDDVPGPVPDLGFYTAALFSNSNVIGFLVYKIINSTNINDARNYYSGNTESGTLLVNVRGLELTQLTQGAFPTFTILDTSLLAVANTGTNVDPPSVTAPQSNCVSFVFCTTRGNFSPTLSGGYSLVDNFVGIVNSEDRTITMAVKYGVTGVEDPPSFGAGSNPVSITLVLRNL